MPTIAPRTSLPQSPHRTANEYIDEISLDLVKEVIGSPDVATVADRADRILDKTPPPGWTSANMPRVMNADGRLSLAELDRLEEPANNAALFASERAAIGAVHSLFEVPALGTVTLPTLPSINYAYNPRQLQAALSTVPIASLPAQLQKAAQRVQLVQNMDQDASTISKNDVLWALAPQNIGSFTQQTVNELQQILPFFKDEIIAHDVTAELGPSSQKSLLAQVGPVKLNLTAKLGYPLMSTGAGQAKLWCQLADRQLSVDAPAGYKVLLRSTAPAGTLPPSAANTYYGEAMVKTNGVEQALSTIHDRSLGGASFDFTTPNQQLWVQVYDAQNQLVGNARFVVPQQSFDPITFAPGAQNRTVTHMKDATGVVRPVSSPNWLAVP